MSGQQENTEEISAREVIECLRGPLKNILLLDVREPGEYAQGHIPGSKNIPLASLDAAAKDLGKEKRLICICLSGGRARKAASFLRSKGYDALCMSGGMLAWKGPAE